MILIFNDKKLCTVETLHKQIQFLHIVTQDSHKIRVDCFVWILCYNMKCRVIKLTLSEVRKPKIILFTLEYCFMEIFVSLGLS